MTCPTSLAVTAALTDEQCDRMSDAILRAAGSALRHYTMQKSKDDIRAAVRASVAEIMETDNASPSI